MPCVPTGGQARLTGAAPSTSQPLAPRVALVLSLQPPLAWASLPKPSPGGHILCLRQRRPAGRPCAFPGSQLPADRWCPQGRCEGLGEQGASRSHWRPPPPPRPSPALPRKAPTWLVGSGDGMAGSAGTHKTGLSFWHNRPQTPALMPLLTPGVSVWELGVGTARWAGGRGGGPGGEGVEGGGSACPTTTPTRHPPSPAAQ